MFPSHFKPLLLCFLFNRRAVKHLHVRRCLASMSALALGGVAMVKREGTLMSACGLVFSGTIWHHIVKHDAAGAQQAEYDVATNKSFD